MEGSLWAGVGAVGITVLVLQPEAIAACPACAHIAVGFCSWGGGMIALLVLPAV